MAMLRNKLKVLVFSDFQGNDANVIRDYLYSFHQYSRHEFFYLHSWKKNNCQRLRDLDLNSFDAIILFWDYYWLGVDDAMFDCCIPAWAVEKIGQSTALKVQFLQDEYRDVRKVNKIMARLGVNLMFTCVAEEDHELFYPKKLIPSLEATHTVLTGYVPRYLLNAQSPPSESRPFDIGYRSRAAPYYLGSVAQEKAQIAHNFQRIGRQYGLTTDISVREEDRLYGEKWLDFLRSSRFSLGTESGASVVDFDGEIRKKTSQYLKANPAATFDEVKDRFFADIDGQPVIQTISPRIFEAVAFSNTLVLHEGAYAKIIQPEVHFISVKKDYSNLDDVIARMRDRSYCQRLANSAREDLIQSGQYNYRNFVERFDAILHEHRPTATRGSDPSRVLFYAKNYLHQDCIIPLGKEHHVLTHPLHLLKILGRHVPDVAVLAHSAKLMGTLLATVAPLRQRLGEWLKNPEQTPVALGGLARDLRILAILQQSRHGVPQPGPAFRVHVGVDGERVVLRSLPAAESSGEDAAALPPVISCVTWDHSKIGDSFLTSHGKDRFFSIFINRQGLYSFDQFHALFQMHPEEERQALMQILFGPATDGSFGNLLPLAASLAYFGLVKKPLDKVRAVAGKLRGQK